MARPHGRIVYGDEVGEFVKHLEDPAGFPLQTFCPYCLYSCLLVPSLNGHLKMIKSLLFSMKREK